MIQKYHQKGIFKYGLIIKPIFKAYNYLVVFHLYRCGRHQISSLILNFDTIIAYDIIHVKVQVYGLNLDLKLLFIFLPFQFLFSVSVSV